MKWSKEYDIYFNEILENVYKYAFSNYIYDPIISQAILPEDYWFPEILNVSDLDKLLHSGIKEALEEKGLIDEIKKRGYDKFIITPDVFSESDVQIDYPYGHIYDMDKRNIIYMNDKLFEIIDKKSMHSLKLNYNNKTYIFYKSGTEDGMLDGIHSKMELISFQEYSFIDEDPNVEDFWDKEGKLILKFCKDRKLYINEEEVNEEYAAVGILHPYILFDYHKDFNDEQIIEDPRLKLYGLKSFNKDMQITEKNYLDDKTKFLIHDTKFVFSSTAVVIFKDKSFIIENFKFPYNEHIITRYDKHTVEVKKDDNIEKIILFIHPVAEIDPRYKVDTIYDKVHAYSNKAFMLLKKHNKKTNDLLNMLEIEENVTIDDLIEFGYKYDRDVLRIIQGAIPMYLNIPVTNDYIYASESIFDKRFLKPKIILRVQNRIKGFPQLIINSRFVSVDYKILKVNEFDYIIIDPVRTFNINRNDLNVNFLKSYISNNIQSIEVCFLTDTYYSENNKRPLRILGDSRINRRIQTIDTFVGENQSILFCNGRLTYSKYVDDPNYKLNYSFHRVPIFNNLQDLDLNDFYKYNLTPPFMAKDVGYTRENKSINILDSDKNGNGSILLDITKENNLLRTSMILNLNKSSIYNYKVFNNKYETNEEGFVLKIPQSYIKDSLSNNRTIFFDYDGLVIKPEILTEHYIDTNFLNLYSHNSMIPNINTTTGEGFENRNKDSFCLHYINLEPVNDKYGLDLRIDEERIDKHFNSGSYNDNVMNDPEIIRLFSYYPKEANRTPIQTYANDYESLMYMKNYVSFWYAFNNDNKLNRKQGYLDLILKRNNLFNSNGTPIENKLYSYFNRNENFNVKDSLFGLEVQMDIISKLFKNSDPYFSNNETIDLNNRIYHIDDNEKYADYINDNNTIILNSIFTIKR